MKYAIKRIFIGVAIALIFFLIKKNVFAKDISSVYSPFSTSNTAIVTNVDNQAIFNISGAPWANWGLGTLHFNFSVIKVGGASTDPVVVPESVTAGNYVCDVSSTSINNSTWTGNTYSATCNMKMGSSGLDKIVVFLTANQQNSNSTYRITMGKLLTYESYDPVSFDSSGTTNAVNNQTTAITNNQNQNTQSIISNDNTNTQNIINNQNQNTQDIINSQKDLLGTQCGNLLPITLASIKATNTSGTWSDNVYTLNGVTFTVNNDLSVTVTGQATANSQFYLLRQNAGVSIPPGTYYFSSSELTGSNSTWKMQFSLGGSAINVFGTGSASNPSSILTSTGTLSSLIIVYSGKNANGVTFYPMISSSSGAPYCTYGSTSSKLDDTNKNLNNVNNSINNVNNTITNHDTTAANQIADNWFANTSINTHGLTAIITAPLSLFSSLLGANCSSLRFPLPFVHNEVELQCMSSIYTTHFNGFLTVYRLITDGIIAYWVSVKVFQKIKGFLDPTDDKVEVFDL